MMYVQAAAYQPPEGVSMSDKQWWGKPEYCLGLCYWHGIGVEADKEQSGAFYKAAADKGAARVVLAPDAGLRGSC